MTNQYPWSSNTTPPIASQDDPRYETPGGAQHKVDTALEEFASLPVAGVADDSVTRPKIRDEAINAPKIAPKAVTRDKISPGSVGSNQLDPTLLQDYPEIVVVAKFQQVDEQLSDIDEQTAYVAGVKYGIVGDGVTDDTIALQNMINNENVMFLKRNTTYRITSPLLLNRIGITLTGGGAGTIIKNDGTGHALIVSARVTLNSFDVTGGSSSKSGIFIGNGCNIKSVHVSACNDYGIEFTQVSGAHIVSCYLDTVTLSYNKKGGLYLNADGNSQKNSIVLESLYVVKNGTDADNLSSDGTPTSGHGIYINGGLGVSINNTVTEYNTGAGVYIDRATGYTLNGFVITNHYYEQNKYAQLLVDYNGASWNNVTIENGSFNAPFSYPSNSLVPTYGNTAFISRNYFPPSVSIGLTSSVNKKSDFAYEKTSLKPNDYMTFDYGSYKGRLTSSHPNGEGNMCLLINQASGGFVENGTENYVAINPHNSYLIEIEYKLFLDGVGNGSISLVPYKNDKTVDPGATQFISTPPQNSAAFVKRKFLYDKTNFTNNTRFLQFQAFINNGMTANSYFLINSMKVIPIDIGVVPTFTTANRPNGVLGLTGFDTTINKPIWHNGTGWVDATGTTV